MHRSLKFEDIVEAYYTGLYRFAFSLTKNEHEAGDLTQQTFFVYARKGDSIRDPSKVKSWLFTTLYQEFLKICRTTKSLTFKEHEELELDMPTAAPKIASQLDAASTVDLLNEIDETYRDPIILFYLQDHSYKEIAAILDIPIGTVMSRISRGKNQLRNLFTKQDTKVE